MKTRWLLIGLFFNITLVLLLHPAILVAGDAKDEVPKISIQDLKDKMDHGEVLIIDVRTGNDYVRSKFKIKGAVRISIVHLAEQSNTLPQDKEIVTYCT